MNELERDFINASVAWAEREATELEAQRQRELEGAQKLAESEKQRTEEQTNFARQLGNRARYLTVAFIIPILTAVTALFFGSQARQTAITAQNDRRIATSRELAAASLINLNIDPERSILLALQSVSTTQNVDGTVLPESLEALHRSVIASPIRLTLYGHEAGAHSAVIFSVVFWVSVLVILYFFLYLCGGPGIHSPLPNQIPLNREIPHVTHNRHAGFVVNRTLSSFPNRMVMSKL